LHGLGLSPTPLIRSQIKRVLNDGSFRHAKTHIGKDQGLGMGDWGLEIGDGGLDIEVCGSGIRDQELGLRDYVLWMMSRTRFLVGGRE